MDREKKNPEREGQDEYERRRRWLSTKTDRELVRDLGYAHREVEQRERLNRHRSAPFAEAKERAKLRAVRDEIAARRFPLAVTIADLPTLFDDVA